MTSEMDIEKNILLGIKALRVIEKCKHCKKELLKAVKAGLQNPLGAEDKRHSGVGLNV